MKLDMKADIALLQEVRPQPKDMEERIKIDRPHSFPNEAHKGRTAIAKLSDQVKIKYLTPVPLNQRESEYHFEATHPGSISAAVVTPSKGTPFTVISFSAEYDSPYHSNCDITDAAVHRVISDLSLFMGCTRKHPRIIAAGDLSVWRGYGGFGGAESDYWEGRYNTVFDRMEAIGMHLVGPDAPRGRQTNPRPEWIPKKSKNVPTHRNTRGTEHQLDFVFATECMKNSVEVRALNGMNPDEWGPVDFVFAFESMKDSMKVATLNDWGPDDWGPSDHCQIEILVEP